MLPGITLFDLRECERIGGRNQRRQSETKKSV